LVPFNFIEIHIEIGKKKYPTHYKKEGKLAAWEKLLTEICYGIKISRE